MSLVFDRMKRQDGARHGRRVSGGPPRPGGDQDEGPRLRRDEPLLRARKAFNSAHVAKAF